MLTLYMKLGCPFCAKVLAEIARLELEFERKDVTSDEAIMKELVDRGGDDAATPYLVDSDQGVEIYESDAIVAHLRKHYDTSTEAVDSAPVRPRLHISDSACISCEG